MCDACGCTSQARYSPRSRKAKGWHVHADGTVHRHDDDAPGHEHSLATDETAESPVYKLLEGDGQGEGG